MTTGELTLSRPGLSSPRATADTGRELKRPPQPISCLPEAADRGVQDERPKGRPKGYFRSETVEPIETFGTSYGKGEGKWSFDSPRSRRRERNN